MRRWLLLCVMIHVLVLIGLGSLRGTLIVLALPLLVYLGAALLDRQNDLQFSATRQLSTERATPGMPVEITLTVSNTGTRAAIISLDDRIPPTLTLIDGHTRLFTIIAPGATVSWSFTVRGQRGVIRFADIQARISDTFGLFPTYRALAAPGQLVIVPEVTRLRQVEIRPRRTNVFAGQIPARTGGPGIEFFGVRPYQSGDPTRWINAHATARQPETLFVNEFEQERVADIGLILDTRAQSDIRTSNGNLFEYAIQATAALADAFLHRGNRVGLLMYGHALDWTFPGYGKMQRERILRALARAETGDLPVFETLDFLPTRLFPLRSQLVLLSALQSADPDMLARLRARGYHVLVISPNPVAFERQHLAHTHATDQAARLARLQRTLLLRRCRDIGVAVVDWPVDMPFQQIADVALSRALVWQRDIRGGV